MPKQRITKEMVIHTAFELAREGGMEKVLVKNIAARIGCSVQPVYCYCKNMEGLKKDVIAYTEKYLERYIENRMDKENMFQSIGMAHAMFAREEPHLYRLYFLRKRDTARSLKDIYCSETKPEVAHYIAEKYHLELEDARKLHMNMMIYNIGISFILSALGENTDIDEIMALLQQASRAFLKDLSVESCDSGEVSGKIFEQGGI